jgi:hypothetical protein
MIVKKGNCGFAGVEDDSAIADRLGGVDNGSGPRIGWKLEVILFSLIS